MNQIVTETPVDLPDGLFPASVRWAAMSPADGDPDMLAPVEQAQIARAVEVRRREYAAVRQLARRLLPQFGLAPCAIPNGADRAPIFPDGVVGSFSHSRELALAIVADAADLAGIGCDVEPCLALPDGVAELALLPEERAAISDLPPWTDRLMFSAKEATYKALYTISGEFLGFDALMIELDETRGTFVARLQIAVGGHSSGQILNGRYRVVGQQIITTLAIARG